MTRTQIKVELGNSLGGAPSFVRNNTSLDEDLEFIEVLMENGDYEYHYSLLQSEANHFVGTGDITPNQFLMWERRQNKWWGLAKNLSSFIITIKRRNVGKEDGIEDPQVKTLFMENIARLPRFTTKVDTDFGVVTRLRKTIHELNKNVENKMRKDELENRNSNSPTQRTSGQGHTTPVSLLLP